MRSRTPRRDAVQILACAAAMMVTVVAQDATTPFVVGVWGQGDAIIPFAEFDGQRWSSHWPAPAETEPDPRPVQRIPTAWWGPSTFQPTWELVEPGGRRRVVQITGTGSAALGSSCSINLGLKTDVPADTYEYGTALSANRSGAVEPVESLASHAADWRTVSALLPGIYQRHELPELKDVSDDVRRETDATVFGPTLDAAYMFRDDRGEFVYFESSRDLARRREEVGDEHSFTTGWLWRPSSTMPFQLVTVRSAKNDGDFKGVAVFRPLGVVRHGSRRFWLGLLGSYAYSGLTVVDVRRAGVKPLLVVDYPGC